MPAPTLEGKLVVAIGSRALFDLAESHRIYTEHGVESYHHYQIETRTSCSRRALRLRW
jgi:5'-nucleotidase